ncbi:hypothetical protein [Zavarzinia sp.]|uniref:hypothetical protein n=1 Tax=Zavarzinia sp. TaxID=2027920 RepID=UPI0035658C6A
MVCLVDRGFVAALLMAAAAALPGVAFAEGAATPAVPETAPAIPPAAPPVPPASWVPGGGEAKPLAEGAMAEKRERWQLRARADAYAAPIDFILDVHREYRPFDEVMDSYGATAGADGFIASLGPTEGFAALGGDCLLDHCVFTGNFSTGGRVVLDVDLRDGKPNGRFAVAADVYDVPTVHGTLEFVGPAAPDVEVPEDDLIHALALAGFILDDYEGNPRMALAAWQKDRGRAPVGPLGAGDWAALKAEADKAAEAAGWTELRDAKAGYVLTYPAKLLVKDEAIKGGGRRLSSADGRFRVEITTAKPFADAAMEDTYNKLVAEKKGRNVQFASLSGPWLEVKAVEKGEVEWTRIENDEAGMRRLVFRFPEDGDQARLVPLFKLTLP